MAKRRTEGKAVEVSKGNIKKRRGLDDVVVSQVEPIVEEIASKPEKFITPSEDIKKQSVFVLKSLYDFAKVNAPKANVLNKSKALPALVVEDLTADQIWEELQLYDQPLLEHLSSSFEPLVADPKNVNLPVPRKEQPEPEEEEEEVDEDEDDDEGEEDESDLEALMAEGNDDYEDDDNEDEGEGLEDLDEDEDLGDEEDESNAKQKKKKDVFFSMDDLERFLADAERKEVEDDEDEDEEEEEVDYFAGYSDDDDEEEQYEDFFDPPTEGKKKKDDDDADGLFGHSDEDEDEDDFEGGEEGNEEEDGDDAMELEEFAGKKIPQTAEGIRRERLQKKIEKLEAENAGEKKWVLSGEVTSRDRPKNSLLEVELDFEHITRAPPVITEEVTQTLEEIIKGRIVEESWDDPIRKKEDVRKIKKEIELIDEKSKESLAEIYEKEYMKQAMGGIPEEEIKTSKEKQEMAALFRIICHRLDALSNFHFTPKPPKEELEIKTKNNLPAIVMEEILPSAVSDSKLKTPEEVYQKPKSLKGETEVTSEEKKNQRRAKKLKKKKEKVVKEAERKQKEKLNPTPLHQQSKTQALKDLEGSSNVKIIGADGSLTSTAAANSAEGKKNRKKGNKPTGGEFTRSSKFFAKLQEEASGTAKQIRKEASGSKGDRVKKASNFKL